MKKIKGQGTVVKMMASRIAAINRSIFGEYISKSDNLFILNKKISRKERIEIKIVSFSSSRDFNEQILSVLSFVRYAGIPLEWTVYSDGTHDPDQILLAETAFSFLKIVKIDFNEKYIDDTAKEVLVEYKEEFKHYADKFALGRRLFLYLNFNITEPVMFIDSDIVFYKQASCLVDILKEPVNGWFLPDVVWGSLDSRYMSEKNPQHYQVNGGCFIFSKELASTGIKAGLDFLRSLNGNYEYFSDQNVFHIIMTENNFIPLNPKLFVLDNEDQFDLSYNILFDKMALRHYVTPVRHKMWQASWKKQLALE